MEPGSLLLQLFIGLLYQHWMVGGDDCGAVSMMSEQQVKSKYEEKTWNLFQCRSVRHRFHLSRARTLVTVAGSR
jgi:hypothetical protein